MAQPLTIDGPALHQRLKKLGEFGKISERGVNSLALTPTNKQARDQVVAWMKEAGLDVSIDKIGNIIGTRKGTKELPPVVVGSHIDTVPLGGIYDGRLGVLAGISAAEAMNKAGIETEHPFQVVVYTAEEGARFQPAMIGSAVATGKLSVEEALQISSIIEGDAGIVGKALEEIGYLGTEEPVYDIHAALELHIEQGPVLDEEGRHVAPVSAVQGISQTKYMIAGVSAHAGGAPMDRRHNPMIPLAKIQLFLEEMAEEMGGHQLATIGSVVLDPNTINVVPSSITFTVDLRNIDAEKLTEAQAKLDAFVQDSVAEDKEMSVTIYPRLQQLEPAFFHPEVIATVQETLQEQGINDTSPIVLGAGHNACDLANVTPAAMITVPSVKGHSHNIEELTLDEDVEAGANTLLNTVLKLDKMQFRNRPTSADKAVVDAGAGASDQRHVA